MIKTEEKTSLGEKWSKAKRSSRCLCEAAIFVAVAQVLSYLKLYQMPYGGSITADMFPIVFFAFRWGWKAGLQASFAYGLMQLVFDGAYAWGWQSMLMDYLFAYTPLGLAGLFTGTKVGKLVGMGGLYVGAVLGCFGRFLIHFVAGATVWASYMPETFSNVYYYSLVYNGGYMLPSTVLTLLCIGFLHKPLKAYFLGEDLK